MELRNLKKMNKAEFGRWIVSAKVKDLKDIVKLEGYIVTKLKKADLIEIVCSLVEENVISIDVEEKIENQVKLLKKFQGLKTLLGRKTSTDLEIADQAIKETLSNLSNNKNKIDKITEEQEIINDLNSKLYGTGYSVKREIYVSKAGDISEETFLCGRDVFKRIYDIKQCDLLCINREILPFWWEEEYKEDYEKDILYIIEEDKETILSLNTEDVTDFNKSIVEIKMNLLDKVNIDQCSTDYFDMDANDYKIDYSIDTLEFAKLLNGTYKENRTTVKLLEKSREQFEDAIWYVESL